jgi:hypothetical protein
MFRPLASALIGGLVVVLSYKRLWQSDRRYCVDVPASRCSSRQGPKHVGVIKTVINQSNS